MIAVTLQLYPKPIPAVAVALLQASARAVAAAGAYETFSDDLLKELVEICVKAAKR